MYFCQSLNLDATWHVVGNRVAILCWTTLAIILSGIPLNCVYGRSCGLELIRFCVGERSCLQVEWLTGFDGSCCFWNLARSTSWPFDSWNRRLRRVRSVNIIRFRNNVHFKIFKQFLSLQWCWLLRRRGFIRCAHDEWGLLVFLQLSEVERDDILHSDVEDLRVSRKRPLWPFQERGAVHPRCKQETPPFHSMEKFGMYLDIGVWQDHSRCNPHESMRSRWSWRVAFPMQAEIFSNSCFEVSTACRSQAVTYIETMLVSKLDIPLC